MPATLFRNSIEMRYDFKTKLKIGFIVLLFLVVGFYAFLKTKDLVYGIRINVDNIKDGETFTEPFIKIIGTAKNAKNLTLNDRKIYIDQNGVFNENLLLLPGYNIITIKGEDKFGKIKQKSYQLLLVIRKIMSKANIFF